MAQTKNTFIKSRMNKDLDERLIPNGEYRDALNIEISQSEDSDVGTVSTALGNVKLTDFGLTNNCEAKIIGIFADEKNKDIYVFITNFIDTSNSKLDLFPNENAICQIWKRNIETNLNTKLAEGEFLNFSLTHEILNINLLEDLLFWTDNRNQPRKINVLKANPGNLDSPNYYTNEDQISVAKYYPFEPIELLDNYIVDYTVTDNGGGSVVDPAGYYFILGEIIPTTASTGVGTGLTVQITSAGSSGQSPPVEGDGNLVAVKIINQGTGYQNGDIINIAPKSGSAQITLVVELQSTMKDKCSEFLPETESFTIANGSTPWVGTIESGQPFAPQPGFGSNPFANFVGSLVKITNSAGVDITPSGARLTNAGLALGTLVMIIEWKDNPQTITTGVGTIITAGVNPDYNANWPGDCEFLKDKFVRFAYRFKFNDNEYSLISPFTQACFVPDQNGYFLSKTRSRTTNNSTVNETIYDSQLAYESTDLEFFENKINSIDLKIPSPRCLNSNTELFSEVNEKMHLSEIDIIYKDDSENVIKVLDTITKEGFESVNSNYIIYEYQSRAPKRVLPEDEITRVSDKVPLKALAQEVSGNRVIYANYVDGHTSNKFLNYQIAAAAKSFITVPESGVLNPQIKKEYQNHTLKQNRTYQVGIVLSDRYGRQSDVILSSLDKEKSILSDVSYEGSTIFHPFYSAGPTLINTFSSPPSTWPGDSLKVQFNSQIPESIGELGYPGLFTDYNPATISNLISNSGYTSGPGINVSTTGGSGSGLTVDYTLFKGNSGYIVSVTINNPGVGYVNGDIITIPGAIGDDATFIYNTNVFSNLTGWYSYKIVVKQQEQDYYNVYLPGIVNGAINEEGLSSSTKATISLYSDNINKIPKDLSDVGPSQTNYRSDTKLSLRVENTSTSSKQYYPGTDVEDVVLLSELTDLGIDLTRVSDVVKANGTTTEIQLENFRENIQPGMSIIITDSSGVITQPLSAGLYVVSYYKTNTGSSVILNNAVTTTGGGAPDTVTFGPPGIIFNSGNNPIVGVLSTSDTIGVAEENDFSTKLAVFETKPSKSLLDIFYETTSAGLISELNSAVLVGTTDTQIPINIAPIIFTLDESQTGSISCTNSFTPTSVVNSNITSVNTTGTLVSVFDGNNANRLNDFELNNNNGVFTIKTKKIAGSGFFVSSDSNKTFFNFTVKLSLNGIDVFKSFSGSIENKEPSYVTPLPPLNYYINKFSNTLKNTDGSFAVFSAINGSGDISLNKNELKWTLISLKAVQGANRPFSPIIQLQDANGNWFHIGSADANSWPTIIRQADSSGNITDNLGAVESYQIVLNREYVNTRAFVRISSFNAVGGLNSTPTTSVDDDSILVRVNSLDTILGSLPSISIDPDGDPNLWQQVKNFFGNNANNDPFNVTVNVSAALNFVTWKAVFKVEDGGGMNAGNITINITQQ